jgi:HD superfamily phosphohydrolase
MREDRSEYFDPLYETITLEQSLPSRRTGFLTEPRDPLNPKDFVQTAEFARLARLRQAGLAWLVFPSATHTRFAHSLGCWWLGRIAEALVKIKSGPDELEPLWMWLHNRKLREEFYLALLFHDIGHGPLSHVLEHNELFVKGLKAIGLPDTDHEHRGAALVRGVEPIFGAWQEVALKRYGKSVKTFEHVRRRVEELEGRVCLDTVCYLMTGDEQYLEHAPHPFKADLPVVKELVSGVLDLDRLDHYARDSYFSGLHQVSMNLRGFLSNLRIIWPAETADGRPLLSLTPEGASYAASLLFNKRLLVSMMFRNSDSVSYHAMANFALTSYLQQFEGNDQLLGQKCLAIALMDDEEFLQVISSSLEMASRYLGQRIRSMRPYVLIRRWVNSDLAAGAKRTRVQLNEYVSRSGRDDVPRLLIHYDKGFDTVAPSGSPQDWLDAAYMVVESKGDPIPVTKHPDFAGDFRHLQESERLKYLWIFARDDEIKSEALGELDSLVRGVGATN